MEKFGSSDGVPIPPDCLVTVCATSGSNTEECLNFEVPLVGVVSLTKVICIIRMLQSVETI